MYALAAYLQSFGEEGIPGRYSLPSGDGRKDVSRSWNPIELVKNPNWITHPQSHWGKQHFLYQVFQVCHRDSSLLHCPTITVTADGVLRAPIATGEITTSMAFDVLSMGVGSDGTSGFPEPRFSQ